MEMYGVKMVTCIEMLNRNVWCYNCFRNAQQKMVIGILNRNVRCYNGQRNAQQKFMVL